jgi:hypothetical protein
VFFPNSRYIDAGTMEVPGPTGRPVRVTRMPVRPAPVIRGDHRRHEGQRLDHLAAHYLADPTLFWRVCDASDAVVPDALAIVELVRIPVKGS